MKQKNGFTLIEVVAIVALLAIIVVIATPIVLQSLNESREKAYVEQTKVLEETAERWAVKNTHVLNETENYYLEISALVDAHLISSDDVLDPRTHKKMTGCLVISYDTGNEQYQFHYNENTCATLKAKK